MGCGVDGSERGTGSAFFSVDSLFSRDTQKTPAGQLVTLDIPVDTCTATYGDLENDVQLLEIAPGYYCLTHSLRHSQIFGDSRLRDAVTGFKLGERVSAEFKQLLVMGGFYVEFGSNKNAYRAELAEKERDRVQEEPNFTLLRILLTDFCNLKCNYCKVVQNVATPQKAATGMDRLSEVLSHFFASSRPSEPKIVHCTGGEPMLHWPEMAHVISETRRLARQDENLWTVVGTNATLVTKERASLFAQNSVKCIVSMDGPADIHNLLRPNYAGRGSWDAVDRGIRLLRAHDVEVSLSVVFGKHNLAQADSIIEYLMERYEPTGLGVNFMKPPTPDATDYKYLIDGEDYAETLYRIHQRWRTKGLFLELVHRKLDPFVRRAYRFHDCGAAGGRNLNIDARGNVGPCKSFLLMNKLSLANLDSTDYNAVVLSRWRQRSPIYYEHCDGCSARGMCGNGCAYDAFVNTGDEMQVDVRSCNYTKRFNELILSDLFQLAGGRSKADREGFFMVEQSDRDLLMGSVAARPGTLSYSIGHHSSE